MNRLHRFKANQKGNDYVVGDIHGNYDTLMDKLDEIGFDKSSDRLFSVGDVIDRGPRNVECLSLHYETWFFGVRGNHEQMMFDSVIGSGDVHTWFANGGSWFALEDSDELRATIHDLSERLPLGIEIDYGDKLIGLVHAEVPFSNWSKAFENDSFAVTNTSLWARRRISRGYGHDVSDIDQVYVGHSFVDEPKNIGNVRYIDTGMGWAGNAKLTIEKIN